MGERINLFDLIRRRLNLKVLLTITLAVSIIMGTVIYLGIASQRKELKNKMVAHGEGLKSLVYAGIKHPMSVGDSVSVERQLLDIRKTVGGISVAICDSDGEIRFATDEGVIGKKVSEFIRDKEASEALRALLETGEQYREKSFEEQVEGKRYMVNFYEVLNEEGCYHCHGASKKVIGGLIVKQSAEETYATIAGLRNKGILVGVVGVCIIIAILYFLLRRLVILPTIEFSRKAREIAEGDLTVEIQVRGEDEISSLGRSINKMAGNLKEMVTNVRVVTNSISDVTENIISSAGRVLSGATSQHNTIEQTGGFIKEIDNSILDVATSAKSLSTSAEDTSSAIVEISNSIGEVAESAKILSESMVEAASSIDEMMRSIKEIADSLQHLTAFSEETASSLSEINATVKEVERSAVESVVLAEKVTADASDQGMKSVGSAVKGMDDIKESVGALSDIINGLGKRSEEIGSILTVIDDVTDQTGLLALNAAILAAQAGEHGKSFAVVAEEIKDLAERTSASTKEISKIIRSVQSETKRSIEMAGEGIKVVEKGMKLVAEINSALKSIMESSHTSVEKSDVIRRATAEEVNVIRQITEAIKSMSGQLERISVATRDQSKGGASITSAIEKIKHLSTRVTQAVGEQSGGSKQISHAMENTVHQANQIANATAEQRQQSRAIVQSIESVKGVAQGLVSLANEMNTVIKSLSEESKSLLSELHRFKV
ncbi:MAG: HAMP domain-containing protein [Nitrospirae bacterium]|nr:HAMP domain-containing protein [Nitrospirota bacterium]